LCAKSSVCTDVSAEMPGGSEESRFAARLSTSSPVCSHSEAGTDESSFE
jgi:hypothetical protein